jgi:hypothetical protein
MAGAVPKESVLGRGGGRGRDGSPAHDSREHGGPPSRSPMAGATETLDAPARELRNSQRCGSLGLAVLKQLEAAARSRRRFFTATAVTVQVPAAAPLHDSRLALRRPFPPRAAEIQHHVVVGELECVFLVCYTNSGKIQNDARLYLSSRASSLIRFYSYIKPRSVSQGAPGMRAKPFSERRARTKFTSAFDRLAFLSVTIHFPAHRNTRRRIPSSARDAALLFIRR